jgi:hypothetical protein
VADRDTVALFSAETLQVELTLKEHIDELRMTATACRSLADSDTVISSASFASEPFTFYPSFYDTGWQTVVFTAHGEGKVLATSTLSLYVRSPLAQDTVRGFYGDTLRLSTPPVRDRGVRYVWSFGAGSDFTSAACSTAVRVVDANASGNGRLWVSDGVHVSPATAFVFELGDTTAPVIACANPGCSGDTVYTGAPVFTFAARISDHGSSRIDSVSVDGGPFDFVSGDLYQKVFAGMQAYGPAAPRRVSVYALDRFTAGNEARRDFYLVYLDTLPRKPAVAITLSSPPVDSAPSGAATYPLVALLQAVNAESLAIVLQVQAGDSLSEERLMVHASASLAWNRTIALADTFTDVVIRALDTLRSDTLGLVHRTIVYAPGGADTVAPTIAAVQFGGYAANGVYSPWSQVTLSVLAYDAGSGIDSVTIGGVRAASAQAPWYTAVVNLAHVRTGNEVVVRATDHRGNDTQQVVTMYFNRGLLFSYAPVNRYISVDSLYHDSIAGVDPDGDTVTFSVYQGPAGLTIATDGRIDWTPGVADSGTHPVVIRAWDGYQPAYYSYNLYVSDWALRPPPVTFQTREGDFPWYLQADRDTLRLALQTVPGSGVAPYRYTARLVGRGQLLLDQSTSNVLQWVPGAGDVGYQRLVVSVSDNIASADTIYPQILVVPANRPCTLSVDYRSPTRVGGVVDLNALGRPDTLRFRIADPDDPRVERHTVVVYQSRSRTTNVVDSAASDTFRVVVDPRAFDGYDTVTAVVSDRGGNRDTLAVVLYYGSPPDVPALLLPANGASGVAVPALLAWQGSDPDGDPLSYVVELGTAINTLTPQATITDSTWSATGLAAGTDYFWRVTARDWKSQTVGPVWRFRTQ